MWCVDPGLYFLEFNSKRLTIPDRGPSSEAREGSFKGASSSVQNVEVIECDMWDLCLLVMCCRKGALLEHGYF